MAHIDDTFIESYIIQGDVEIGTVYFFITLIKNRITKTLKTKIKRYVNYNTTIQHWCLESLR